MQVLWYMVYTTSTYVSELRLPYLCSDGYLIRYIAFRVSRPPKFLRYESGLKLPRYHAAIYHGNFTIKR
jgi:hypothetical protein